MRGPTTLRGRISLIAVGITAGWVLLITVGFNVALGAQLEQQADSVLRTRAEAVATTIDVSPLGAVSVRDVRDVRDDAAIDVDTWIFVGTRVLEAPAGGDALRLQAAALAGVGERSMTTGTTQPVRLLAVPVLLATDQVATVVTTLSLAPYRQTEETAIIASAFLAAFFLAGVYLVVRISTDRALRPVEDMAEQADRWSADDVDRRFGRSTRPAELEELAERLDGVLDRISAVVRHEKTFSAQVSHELRTPLAAIVAESDLLRAHPRTEADVDAALNAISAGAERMTRILDTLLSAARSATGAPPGRCDVHDVVVGLRDRWVGPSRLTVDVPVGTMTGVDSAVLERIVAPVLENAARYARREVTVTGRGVRSAVEVVVSDDGPGLTPEAAAYMFDPGWRAHPADGHDGAGLGLALSHRLVLAAGGRIDASASVGTAGATISISLPAA